MRALRRRYGRSTRSKRHQQKRLGDRYYLELGRLSDLLTHAMNRARERGYTGMVGSKGAAMDDPDVRRLMKRMQRMIR